MNAAPSLPHNWSSLFRRIPTTNCVSSRRLITSIAVAVFSSFGGALLQRIPTRFQDLNYHGAG